ncbi:MAG: ABC transporter substrate-binding protein [Clostridia bacterium]|nr:ABC transporter substrate-binding protein [Clostridia bacterium]
MKRLFAVLLCAVMLFGLASCKVRKTDGSFDASVLTEKPAPEITVTCHTDNTGIAFAYFKEKLSDDYTISFTGASTDVAALLKAEKTTVAVCSLTQAAELYNSTGGGAQILCVNTLGGIYILSKNIIRTGKDLVDENIYVAGEGSQTDYMLRSLLDENSLTTGADVQITYMPDEAQTMSAALDGTAQTVVLTEPYASKVLAATDFKTVLNLSEEWAALGSEDMQAVCSCVVATRDFVNNNPDEVEKLLDDIRTATAFFSQDNSTRAAEMLVKNNFYNDAAVAETALSDCGAVCLTGKEMRTLVNLNVSALYTADPASMGGNLPDDGFCYIQ